MYTVQLGRDLIEKRGTVWNPVLAHAFLQLPTQFLKARGTAPSSSSPLLLIAGDQGYQFECDIEIAAGGTAGLILFYDDLGYGDLASYGHPIIKTPNLDAFAQQGVRLTQCYSASP